MAGAMDLRALRPYVPGDELRHLHWKATARTGQLMVREYVDPAQPWCVVVLDTRRDVLDADGVRGGRRDRRLGAVGGRRAGPAGAAGDDRRAVLDVRSGTTGLRAAGEPAVPGRAGRRTGAAAALDLATVGARLGDGWFVHVGGPPGEAVAVQAARYAEAIAFDVSAGPTSQDRRRSRPRAC